MTFRPLNFPAVAMLAGALNVVIPPPTTNAETRTARAQCRTMLRIVDVPASDVLYIRNEPRVPEPPERSNQLAGIPATARGIEDLGPAEGDWRRVRYLGIVGYARGRYLTHDISLCVFDWPRTPKIDPLSQQSMGTAPQLNNDWRSLLSPQPLSLATPVS